MSYNIDKFTADELRLAFDYDATTGVITRKCGGRFSVAGNINFCSGKDRVNRIEIRHKGSRLAAHHVAWKIFHGVSPRVGMIIDHEDGNPLNNRISNLREVTPQQNCINKKPGKGYYKTKSGKYTARIYINYKRISLGTFQSEEEAAEAYKKAVEKYHGEFARK